MKEKIESMLGLKYPNAKITYDQNYSPLLLNGVENINFENLNLIVFFNKEENSVLWNEKNQSNVIYLKDQITSFQNKLNLIEAKAIIFN